MLYQTQHITAMDNNINHKTQNKEAKKPNIKVNSTVNKGFLIDYLLDSIVPYLKFSIEF